MDTSRAVAHEILLSGMIFAIRSLKPHVLGVAKHKWLEADVGIWNLCVYMFCKFLLNCVHLGRTCASVNFSLR